MRRFGKTYAGTFQRILPVSWFWMATAPAGKRHWHKELLKNSAAVSFTWMIFFFSKNSVHHSVCKRSAEISIMSVFQTKSFRI